MARYSQGYEFKECHSKQLEANFLRRVLVIDDQRSIRVILSMLLTELGFNVETAEDGEEGIHLFKSDGDFDLIITDIRMPKVDGNEVARYIRKSRRPNIPVIAITGFPEEAEMDLFDYALVKPFKLEMLRSICARFKPHDRPVAPALGDGA